MKGIKLINLLKTLTPDEMISFEKFIASPFFNSVKNHAKLFNELKKFYPAFEDSRLTPEYIYKKLFKGKAFNKQIMWNLTSAFEKLAKEFLEQVSLGRKKFQRMELLVEEFGRRKLISSYPAALKDMEILLDEGAIDYTYFENKGHLETYKQIYYFSKNDPQAMGSSKLRASEYQILLFLRMTVGSLYDMSVLSKDYNQSFDVNIPLEFAKHIDLKSIAAYARNKNFEYAFLIEIYYHSLMMLLKPLETEHLNKVRRLYKMHYDKFNLPEKRIIMHWLLIYCIPRAEAEGVKYEKIIFELNKFRLKEGLVFYPAGQLHEAIYIQMLSAALSIGKIKWTENFIRDYTPMLQPQLRESKKAVAYAFLHFQKKEYDKVFKDINNFGYTDIWDKLFAKTLLAKTYYEMKEFDSLLYHIDSAKHFLKNNNSVSKPNKKYHGDFFYFLAKLVALSELSGATPAARLKDEILTAKVESKKWLLEKADEIDRK
jgi:hypothetical protein